MIPMHMVPWLFLARLFLLAIKLIKAHKFAFKLPYFLAIHTCFFPNWPVIWVSLDCSGKGDGRGSNRNWTARQGFGEGLRELRSSTATTTSPVDDCPLHWKVCPDTSAGNAMFFPWSKGQRSRDRQWTKQTCDHDNICLQIRRRSSKRSLRFAHWWNEWRRNRFSPRITFTFREKTKGR